MNDTPSPVFLIAFCLLVLVASPVWIPVAMLASLARGKSLRELNEEANSVNPSAPYPEESRHA